MRRVRLALETQYAYGVATGLGVYARGLRDALRAFPDLEVLEVCRPGLDLWSFPRRVYWDQWLAPRAAARYTADVVHFTGGTLPFWPPHPCVVTVHDLAWSLGSVPAPAYSQAYFGWLQPRLLRRADAIVTDTAASQAEIARLTRLPADKVLVAGAAVAQSFFELERRPSDAPFVLSVGTIEARKDLATAVRMLLHDPQLRLLAAGPHTAYAGEVRALADGLGVGERLQLLGYVDEARLHELYASALALVFPSRYEGFGLPPLQALAAGLPVVASDLAVTREVLGEHAWFVRPGDSLGFARAVAEIRDGGDAVAARVQAGHAWARRFTWPAVAAKLRELYRKLASIDR